MSRRFTAALLAAACCAALPAAAQPVAERPAFIPSPLQSSGYDASIPTPEQILGHQLGQRITPTAAVHRYFEALQAAAPDRMRIGQYGQTHEGRPLLWSVIGSPENIARIDQIQAAAQALADPRRTDAARAQALMADQPAIVWLAHSVHGNEISPAESAMAIARHLLASPDDPRVQAILDNTLVFILPTQNPDGRERFIASYAAAAGIRIDPDPLSAERAERWPTGRFNSALFDLNRDWFAQTQPETRGHSALLRSWSPHVVVDAHEMGTDDTFFFPPEAEPHNPLLPPRQMETRAVIGRNTGQWFDRLGLDYFTREVYDAFYPGYGDAWPSYLGAVSMTYEQGSARGLAARRSSGDILTYPETIQGHFTAALSTLEAAARERARLLSDHWAHSREAVARTGGWLLPRDAADPGAADRLAELMALQGVEVSRASGAACGQSMPQGGYAIAEGQPMGPLARVLFDRSIALRPGFLEEQERRRALGLDAQIYDVTAWSLPLAFNTPVIDCRALPTGERLEPGRRRIGAVTGPTDSPAWIVSAGTQAFRFMTAALDAGLRVRSPEAGFTLDGRPYPAGSMIVTRGGNPDDVDATIARLAAETGADVTAVGDTWVTEGPSFGSDRSPVLKAARVALAWDDGTSPTAAGSVRHVLEREYGWPVTVVAVRNLARADLSGFDAVILPDGGYGGLGEVGLANLRGFTERGGVLVAMAGAAEAIADPKARLLAARLEGAAAENAEDDDEAADTPPPGDLLADEDAYLTRVRGTDRELDQVAGAFLGARVDRDHWLAAGVPEHISILYGGAAVFHPLTLEDGVNVVRFEGPNDLLEAGQLWSENRAQLAYKPAVMAQPLGDGWIVAFAQDPTLRGFLRGQDGLLLNALFRGPVR
ncbi:M14 family zinc carboxypeptidase [Brevundimonas sp.]|uniref:M14 family zinc carboxypeptidase n=1 Tax=Brevundimonas sp. TaxID=1871086 RepID=UPI0035AE0351